jgi:hypothetical protein
VNDTIYTSSHMVRKLYCFHNLHISITYRARGWIVCTNGQSLVDILIIISIHVVCNNLFIVYTFHSKATFVYSSRFTPKTMLNTVLMFFQTRICLTLTIDVMDLILCIYKSLYTIIIMGICTNHSYFYFSL